MKDSNFQWKIAIYTAAGPSYKMVVYTAVVWRQKGYIHVCGPTHKYGYKPGSHKNVYMQDSHLQWKIAIYMVDEPVSIRPSLCSVTDGRHFPSK